ADQREGRRGPRHHRGFQRAGDLRRHGRRGNLVVPIHIPSAGPGRQPAGDVIPPSESTPMTKAIRLHLESLEARRTPAPLVAPFRLIYRAVDGNRVSFRFSKPVLSPGNVNSVFGFDSGAVAGDNSAGQQLQVIALTVLGPAAAGMSITITAAAGAAGG